ncbi:hypothetical protein LIER_01878 [Lithospermum erythrorhizon]|uniref:Uncharacterized protein n=1 Tax=Lithospermum erythrorhizon TaxID=34254 RepID=A0AAV3NNL6_LITER
MEDPMIRERHEFNLASRKAEEAALRRYQATHWLDCMVGPLSISSQPNEKEFVSSLRNGLVLCNLMNKIQPGSVPKVVECALPSQSLAWDSQPLPAYQYFENVKNFLVAVEELKLPAFEASVLERENIEAASSAKVVDCILALKGYYEWKEMTGGKGSYKPPRSPFFHDPARRINQQSCGWRAPSDSCRRLDMSSGCNLQQAAGSQSQGLEDLIVKICVERMADAKENIDNNFLASLRQENMDPVNVFSSFISKCVEEKLKNKFPEVISDPVCLTRDGKSFPNSISRPLRDISSQVADKGSTDSLSKKSCHNRDLLVIQERELLNLKALLSTTRKKFGNLQSQMQSDFRLLAYQVHEMSTAALGYHKVVNENRMLYNMLQDLKGNIRVYCRIRPSICSEEKTVIDFVGNDGSLVVVDPMKPPKDGRKIFQFNRVFGPSATQDEVFQDTQPLIRSVMDGYNVCIFAYGQTGSGKTYTMSGPSRGSSKDCGINCMALNDLFHLSDERKDIMVYDIQVQMVEIYNEQVRDLLAKDSSATRYPFMITTMSHLEDIMIIVPFFICNTLNYHTLEILNCLSDGGLNLPDATMQSVKTTADVISLMEHGDLNRAVCSTAINNRSSRSHSVLTVHVVGEDVVTGSKLRSCLHLVDLAGSERVDKSEVTGEALKEAQFINKSLSCLGDVIAALAQKNSHIPYRNSKLTQLLQNSLGRQAKTLMFAHVSPEVDSFGETMSTLKFAQRASTVELGTARSNKESSEILHLKAEIESLKQALASDPSSSPQTMKAKEAVKGQRNNLGAQRTPPRPRRLSIENCNTMKSKEGVKEQKNNMEAQRTPPHLRRLSIENCNTMKSERTNLDLKKVLVSELTSTYLVNQTNDGVTAERNNLEAQRTPPRPRRTSIENCNTMKSERTNLDLKKEVKTPPSQQPRSRRLSLEARFTNITNPTKPEVTHQDVVAIRKPSELRRNVGSYGLELNNQRALRSPTTSALRKKIINENERVDIASLELLRTPEPAGFSRNALLASSEFRTPSLNNGTTGKRAQIRKSLRTIGKLINGSEKRNQPKTTEPKTPFNGTSKIHDIKSPMIPASVRASRRQSLTAIVPPERSRRSSIGGVNANRTAKTPPPVNSSGKLTNRWL